MRYFCIENQSTDRHAILGVAISLNIFMPNATLCLVCSDETHAHVKGFYDFKINIIKVETEHKLTPSNMINNMLSCIKNIHESNNDAFYLSNSVIIVNSLEELENKDYTSPIVCLKRDVDMKSENAKYPMCMFLVRRTDDNLGMESLIRYQCDNNEELLASEEQHTNLQNISIDNMTDDEINDLRNNKTLALEPISRIAQELLSTLVNKENVITEFFEAERYVDLAQFFGFEGSWKLSDFKADEGKHIVRNNTKCLLTTTCLDPNSLPSHMRTSAMELWSQIEAIMCFNDPRINIVQNITNRLFGNRFVISGPKNDLFGNWSRNDVPSLEKTIIQLIMKSEYINYNQSCTRDYYRTGFSLIYDYKDSSLFKGDMFASRKTIAIILNYDNKVLSQLDDKGIYCGLYTPYSLLLERESSDLPDTRNDKTYHFTDDKMDVYKTEDMYIEYIKDLKNYTKSFITDKTPKSHVVDCLGLGVIPVIDEDCRLLEIEDIDGDSSDYLDYFNKNLTIDALTKRLIKVHMEYIQKPHEPISST